MGTQLASGVIIYNELNHQPPTSATHTDMSVLSQLAELFSCISHEVSLRHKIQDFTFKQSRAREQSFFFFFVPKPCFIGYIQLPSVSSSKVILWLCRHLRDLRQLFWIEKGRCGLLWSATLSSSSPLFLSSCCRVIRLSATFRLPKRRRVCKIQKETSAQHFFFFHRSIRLQRKLRSIKRRARIIRTSRCEILWH